MTAGGPERDAAPGDRDGATTGGPAPGAVLVVVEQLRRSVPGGIGTYARGLLQGLRSLERAEVPDVALYASRGRARPDPLLALGFPVVSAPVPGPVLTRAWDHALVGGPRRFDVVHAVSLATPPPRGRTVVVAIHDLAWRHVPDAYPSRGRRWHEAALRRALRRGSRFVVASGAVRDELASEGVAPEAVALIPLGSDHLPAPDDDAGRALLAGLGVQGPFLLSVGTLEPRKNLARLGQAYALARRSLPEPWPLVVVGPAGWGRAQDAGGAGVVFAGRHSGATLAALYQRARLLAYVPVEEGYGLPPLEAMRLGTPVVASPVPSVGDAALAVDPLSVEDIADALVRAAGDEVLRHDLAARGRAHAERLTWAASARAHLAVWSAGR